MTIKLHHILLKGIYYFGECNKYDTLDCRYQQKGRPTLDIDFMFYA